MKLSILRIVNFQCFGPESQEISFEDSTTMIIGPNGSGKTAILQALGRMFDVNPGGRRIRHGDFHVPVSEESPPDERVLSIEADFVIPEVETSEPDSNTIPPCFNHMRLDDEGENLKVRFRLEATMGPDGDIDESLYYVLGKDQNGDDKLKRVSRAERNYIAVYYLPARRDPYDQIRSTTTSLLGKIVRAIDWSEEAEQFSETASDIQRSIASNSAIGQSNEKISKNWSSLHKGSHFRDANISFGDDSFERLIENFSVKFTPAHVSENVDYSLLSDGQKSLLYLSLVIAYIEIGRSAMIGGESESLEIRVDKLNPPTFSIIAIEEPENSLSPHYLGRINKLLADITSADDAQAIITTHAPSMLKRIPPKQIRHARLGVNRTSTVKSISLPPSTEMDAHKYVREGLLSNPEIYFARMVVLGEGASEDIVLPKLFESAGLPVDENGIVLAQLGGRHVNYLWRILSELDIPFVTLLDLDLGRHQAGWGRLKYARDQLAKVGVQVTDAVFPKWDESSPLEKIIGKEKLLGEDWFNYLKQNGVFFSAPLDLDFSMLKSYPEAYSVFPFLEGQPDESTCKSVLGKKGYEKTSWFTDEQKELFEEYHRLFKLGSKPAAHIEGLSNLSNNEIDSDLPEQYRDLINYVALKLEEVYE